MNQKRILLVHEDPLLTTLFQEKLGIAGFAVDAVRSGDEGLALLEASQPDAVVLDPVTPGPEIMPLIRSLRPTPVIVLPTTRPALLESAQEAGADVVLARSDSPVMDVIEALQTKLGVEKTTGLTMGLSFRDDPHWLSTSLGSAPEVMTGLRRALHGTTREGGDPIAAAELYRLIHSFTEQMAVFGERPLYCLAAQIEALAHDLCKYPDQTNPSVLRTLGQSIDFLSTLLRNDLRGNLTDPSAAEILVVDDEEGAQRIIMAAMRLANLKSVAADTPTTGLSALGVQGFNLIFLDVGLPEMTGFELCAKIRALPMHEKTPIIFITGMATFQNRVQSSLSGGNDFVGKPFSIPELGLKALIWIFKSQLGML